VDELTFFLDVLCFFYRQFDAFGVDYGFRTQIWGRLPARLSFDVCVFDVICDFFVTPFYQYFALSPRYFSFFVTRIRIHPPTWSGIIHACQIVFIFGFGLVGLVWVLVVVLVLISVRVLLLVLVLVNKFVDNCQSITSLHCAVWSWCCLGFGLGLGVGLGRGWSWVGVSFTIRYRVRVSLVLSSWCFVVLCRGLVL
jgi:hypothetical protein